MNPSLFETPPFKEEDPLVPWIILHPCITMYRIEEGRSFMEKKNGQGIIVKESMNMDNVIFPPPDIPIDAENNLKRIVFLRLSDGAFAHSGVEPVIEQVAFMRSVYRAYRNFIAFCQFVGKPANDSFYSAGSH